MMLVAVKLQLRIQITRNQRSGLIVIFLKEKKGPTEEFKDGQPKALTFLVLRGGLNLGL